MRRSSSRSIADVASSPRLQPPGSCVLLSTTRSKDVLLDFRAAPCFSARPFERSCCVKHSARAGLNLFAFNRRGIELVRFCNLPAGPRSGRIVLRLQSIPTSKRTNELLRRRKRGRRGRRRRLGGRRASTSGRASEGQRGRWRGATDRSPAPVPGSQRVVQGSVRRWAAWNAPGVPWAIFGGSKEVASVTGA